MRIRHGAAAAIAAGLCALTLATPSLVFAEGGYVSDAQLSQGAGTALTADSVVPDAYQYEYQKDGLAAFCHFGPNTYTGREWGDNYGDKKPDEIFKLSQHMDADAYVKALKKAGFTKLIVTAKHHDGFCIWKSAYTDYDSDNTQGKIDVLAEISKACSDNDMDMGLYLSPWDIHDDSYGYYDAQGKPCDKQHDAKDYNKYYNDQLTEILSNPIYGNKGVFKEVWMDGAKGSGQDAQDYDFPLWFKTIQKYEGKEAGRAADCMLFGAEARTTVRWIGNEQGLANEETWAKSQVDEGKNTIDSGAKGQFTVGKKDGNKWTVPEADARITPGWFWGKDKANPKSMTELSNMYFNSVGHNATFLLNVPPNTEGKVDPAIIKRVEEFGKGIQDTFGENLAAGAAAKATNVRSNATGFKAGNVVDGKHRTDEAGGDTVWSTDDGVKRATVQIDLKGKKTFDIVSIEEGIQFGQRITKHTIEYRDADGTWQTFSSGTTIGSKRLSRQRPVTSDAIRVTVETEKGVPVISEIGVYKASKSMELPPVAPEGFKTLDIADTQAFNLGTGWTSETGSQYVNGTNAYASGKGKKATLKFHGTKAYLVGTVDPNHGTALVKVDGKLVRTVNTHAATRATGQTLFVTDDLPDGDHTIEVEVSSDKAIGLECAHVIDNGGRGFVELDTPSLEMYAGETYQMPVHRVGGDVGELTVLVQAQPGSAVQGDFDTATKTVTFKDGQTEATVPVTTRQNNANKGDLDFTVELASESGAPIAGFVGKTHVKILDTENFDMADLQKLVNRADGHKQEDYSSGWDAFAKARADAKKLVDSHSTDKAAVSRAYVDLALAEKALVFKGSYASAPFEFPGAKDATSVLEPELGILMGVGGSGEEWRLGVDTADWAGNKKFVNCMNAGDQLVVPFHAARAGVFEAEVTYRSGSAQNGLSWSTKPGSVAFIDSGAATVGATNAEETKTAKFDLTVSRGGAGALVFTAPGAGAPQIDKITLKAKSIGEAEPELPTYVRVWFDDQVEETPNSSATVVAGQKVSAPVDPTRDGYSFGGWFADAACTQPFDFEVPVTKSVTVYAKWTKNEEPQKPAPEPGKPEPGEPGAGGSGNEGSGSGTNAPAAQQNAGKPSAGDMPQTGDATLLATGAMGSLGVAALAIAQKLRRSLRRNG